MLQELLPILPQTLDSTALAAVATLLALATVLWLTGARFNRPLITLATVALGGAAGMLVPRWYGWGLHTMATAVAGAMVLGLTGYLLTRVWVGLGLGALLAGWAALATWIAYRNGTTIAWPQGMELMTVPEIARTMWLALPDEVRRLLPYATAAAMISGLSIGLLWKNYGAGMLLYSVLGITMMSLLVPMIVNVTHPQWFNSIPPEPMQQGILLAGLAIIGATIQWLLVPIEQVSERRMEQQPKVEAVPQA